MTMKVTPEIIAAAYDFLRITPPFKAWKLPAASDVRMKFTVTRSRDTRGEYNFYYNTVERCHEIKISDFCTGHSKTLLQTLAHEMVHLRLRLTKRSSVGHGPAFQVLANRVCKHHGFDPREF